ncbi:hypothetical protein DMENIID0001_131960 [Sergentomyia squamirostris]
MAKQLAEGVFVSVLLLTTIINVCHSENNSSKGEKPRWSRQIQNSGFVAPSQPTGSDWVPITQNCPTCQPGGQEEAKERAGRVLNYPVQPPEQQLQSSAVPSAPSGPTAAVAQNPFLTGPPFASNDLAQPSAPQSQQPFPSLLNDNLAGQRFVLQPPSQSFHFQHPPPPRTMSYPYNPFNFPPGPPPPPPPPPPSSTQAKPFLPTIPAEFGHGGPIPEKPRQTYHHHHPPPPPPPPVVKHQKPHHHSHHQHHHQPDDEIQLLYVPLDTFYQQKQQPPAIITHHRYNILPPPVNPAQINNFYTPPPPLTPSSTTTTTSTPLPPQSKAKTKLKPHQPPLAMFMRHDAGEQPTNVNDVLKALKHARNIDVLDSPTMNAPKIFIGPSGLKTPNNYYKYDLPYLSTIEQNRFERKVENLPFFVAPLSYRTPNGFAKIPLPAPHVGSVVVNSPETQPELSTPVTKKPSYYGTSLLPQKYDPQTNKYIDMPLTENYSSQNAPIAASTTLPPTAVSGFPGIDRLPSFTTHAPRQYFTSPEQSSRVQQSFGPNPGTFQFSFDSTGLRPRPSQTKPKTTFTQNTNPHIVNEEYFSLDKTKTAQMSQDFTGPVDLRYEQKINPQVTPNFNFDFRTQPKEQSSTDAPQEIPPPQAPTRQGHFILSAPPQQDFHTFNRAPPKVSFTATGPFESAKETYNAYDVPKRPSLLNYYPSSTTTTTTTPPPPPPSPTTITYYKPKPPVSLDSNFQEQQPPRRPVHNFRLVPTVLGTTLGPYDDEQQPVNSYRVQPLAPERNVFTKTTAAPQPPTTRRPIIDESFFIPTDRTVYQNVFPTDSTLPPSADLGSRHQLDEFFNAYSTTEEPATTTPQAQTTQNLYQQPYSELPQINANLPGLVNSLMDADLVTEDPYTTTTRRPLHRSRRPPATLRTTSSTAQTSEAATRRPVQRTRTRPTRPPNTTYRTSTAVRNPNRVRFNPDSADQSTQVRSKPHKTHSHKVKEEHNLDYQRDVLKQNYPVIKPTYTTTIESVRPTEPQLREQSREPVREDSRENYYDIRSNLEENQVTLTREEPLRQQEFILPANHAPGPINDLPTTILSTTAETILQQQQQEEEERTEIFPGLNVKAMQVPQEYAPSARGEQQFSSRDEEPERVVVINGKPRDSKFPVYFSTTEPSTTTIPTSSQAPTTVVSRHESQRIRRPSFVKRPTRPIYTTTSPRTPTTDANEEKYTVSSRGRLRSENRAETTTQRPVNHKFRSRLRRPTTTTTTVQYDEDYQTDISATEEPKSRYKSNNRTPYRVRQKSRFGLQTQESQWSTKLSQQSFQPLDYTETGKGYQTDYDQDNEPEIVTAGANVEEESYSFNVTPGRTPNMLTYGESEKKKSKPPQETTLANLLDEVVTEVDNELTTKSEGLEDRTEVISKRPEADSVAGASSTAATSELATKGKRRGVWRRVRVRPLSDTFETAESINIGRQVFNVLPSGQKEAIEHQTKGAYTSQTKLKEVTSEETTSPGDIDLGTGSPDEATDLITDTVTEEPITETRIPDETSPVVDYTDMDTEETYTAKVEPLEIEKTTPASSMFDEVRKKLVDLFMLPEDDDQRTENPFEGRTFSNRVEPTTTTTTEPPETVPVTEYTPFLRDPVMGNLIIATSTSTEISHQTEICYRGRCIKSARTKP